MWLQGEIVSNHDLVTYDMLPLRLSVCLHSWECNLSPPTAHTHTHTRPTPPGQQFSKLFRSGQKLEAIFLEIKAIVQHFGNLLCDPSDPTTPKRTCTFTTQWNNSATLPVRGFRGWNYTPHVPAGWSDFRRIRFTQPFNVCWEEVNFWSQWSFNGVVMMFSLLTKTHNLVWLIHSAKWFT